MEFFPNAKTFVEFHIGGLDLTIQWYAVLIMSGAFLAYYLSLRNAKKIGYGKELLEDYFLYLMPLSVVGARIWYVIFAWNEQGYGNDLIRVFNVTEGGLAIHGGLITGIIFSYFFFKKRGVNLLRIGDCIMPNVLLAQAIGRWGNFINQEAYGDIVSADFFKGFPSFIKDNMFIDGAYRQPMFLFEGIGNVIGFILITFVFKKFLKRKRGDMIYAYVTWYGLVRFVVEIYRSDALMAGSLKIAQLTSIAFIVIGLLGYFGVFDKLFKKFYPFKIEKPTILFDMDGTLLDSISLIMDSFKHIFTTYKPEMEVSDELLRSFMGPSLVSTFTTYFPNDVDKMIDAYQEYNQKQHDSYVKAMPHAIELLDSLKEEGYEMAIVSNKMEDMVHRGLEVSGLKKYFDVVITGSDVKQHKPNPEGLLIACEKLKTSHDSLVYVGDAVVDIKASKAIGAYSIIYLHDRLLKDQIEELKPNRIVYDLLDIKEILKENNHAWEDIV